MYNIITTGATSGEETAQHSFNASNSGACVAHSLVFCIVFCRSLFVFCPFTFGHYCIF